MSLSKELKHRHELIAEACKIIETDLSFTHTIESIASRLNISAYYFQRLFAASLGETVAGYIKSRRLEKGALLLSTSNQQVISVALDCGFETHSAFTRAFKKRFGVAPGQYADFYKGIARHLPANSRPHLKAIPPEGIVLQTEELQLQQMYMIYRVEQGVIDGSFFSKPQLIAQAFKDLAAEADQNCQAFCTGYPVGPAGYNDHNAKACYGGVFSKPIELDWSSDVHVIQPGLWIVIPHWGSLTYLNLTWNKACRSWLPVSDYVLRSEWMLEVYLGKPSDVDPKKMTAQIYLPVAKKHKKHERNSSNLLR
jgi:AraC-like DNA-binding protein